MQWAVIVQNINYQENIAVMGNILIECVVFTSRSPSKRKDKDMQARRLKAMESVNLLWVRQNRNDVDNGFLALPLLCHLCGLLEFFVHLSCTKVVSHVLSMPSVYTTMKSVNHVHQLASNAWTKYSVSTYECILAEGRYTSPWNFFVHDFLILTVPILCLYHALPVHESSSLFA
jgi:hypothetical protein